MVGVGDGALGVIAARFFPDGEAPEHAHALKPDCEVVGFTHGRAVILKDYELRFAHLHELYGVRTGSTAGLMLEAPDV